MVVRRLRSTHDSDSAASRLSGWLLEDRDVLRCVVRLRDFGPDCEPLIIDLLDQTGLLTVRAAWQLWALMLEEGGVSWHSRLARHMPPSAIREACLALQPDLPSAHMGLEP